MTMASLPQGFRAVVWGTSGGIGTAFLDHLSRDARCGDLVAISREPGSGTAGRAIGYDPGDEKSIAEAAAEAADGGPVHLTVVATGTLHGEGYEPEKALRQFDPDAFLNVMRINAVLPALIGKASLKHLARERTVFAALSARVGSIGDNRLGGWHSYRASKAALNMVLRNIAIEVQRKNKAAVVAGIHPGTVDTALSEPFQGNVPEGKLFTPEYSTGRMLTVLDGLSPEQSGTVFDYAGEPIPF